jgi:hypothetical protein
MATVEELQVRAVGDFPRSSCSHKSKSGIRGKIFEFRMSNFKGGKDLRCSSSVSSHDAEQKLLGFLVFLRSGFSPLPPKCPIEHDFIVQSNSRIISAFPQPIHPAKTQPPLHLSPAHKSRISKLTGSVESLPDLPFSTIMAGGKFMSKQAPLSMIKMSGNPFGIPLLAPASTGQTPATALSQSTVSQFITGMARSLYFQIP